MLQVIVTGGDFEADSFRQLTRFIMKTKLIKQLLAVLLCTAFVDGADAQTNAFTYQGSLGDGGEPAQGSYEMQFTLLDLTVVGYPQVRRVEVRNQGPSKSAPLYNACRYITCRVIISE